jgi:hypothetical protein
LADAGSLRENREEKVVRRKERGKRKEYERRDKG